MGAMFLSSCSSDDALQEGVDQPAAVTPTSDYLQKLTDASKKLNLELSSINLGDLAPLDDALNNGCECECKCGDNCNCEGCADNHKKFSEALKALLNKLNEDFSWSKPYSRTYTFENILKQLKLTWTVAGINGLEREDGEFYASTINSRMFKCEYKTNTCTYTVTVSKATGHYLENWEVMDKKARQLSIYKDDTPVLEIITIKNVGEHWVFPFRPADMVEYTGFIKVSGMNITLGFDRDSAHERNLSLKVEKEGDEIPLLEMTSTLTDNRTLANILKGNVAIVSDFNVSIMGGSLGINGQVKNLSKLVLEAVALYGISKKGTSEEVCNNIVSKFNENSNFDLMSEDSNIGKLFMQPVYNKESGKYIPALMIDSPLFGEEPVNIAEILSGLGITFEDILQLIMGGAEESSFEQ